MTIIPIRDEAHWHELRAKHVGGSEVAALFGACSYLTHLELWLIKRGEISGHIPDNDRMFWGRVIEASIALGVEQKMGWVLENPKAYYVCPDTPGMGCTPDRVIASAPGRTSPGLLQIKNVDRLEYLRWEDASDGRGKVPPLAKQLQLQHELACAGFAWGALAILVGGNELALIEYETHPGAVSRIKAAVGEFWASVASGVQPKAVAEDYDILRDLYGDASGPPADMTADNHLPVLCAAALDAAEMRKAAEKEEKAAKAEILQRLGNAGRAFCVGFELKKTAVHKEPYMVKEQNHILLNIKKEKEA